MLILYLMHAAPEWPYVRAVKQERSVSPTRGQSGGAEWTLNEASVIVIEPDDTSLVPYN